MISGIGGVANYQYLSRLRQSQSPINRDDISSAFQTAMLSGLQGTQTQSTTQPATQGGAAAFLMSLFQGGGEISSAIGATGTAGSTASQQSTAETGSTSASTASQASDTSGIASLMQQAISKYMQLTPAGTVAAGLSSIFGTA